MKLKPRVKATSFDIKKRRYGVIFSLPFILGFVLMYMTPLISSIIYSFSKVTLSNTGIKTEFIGMENYIFAFTKDAEFIRKLGGSLLSTLYQIPLILIFSLFIALILNHKFRGRLVVRAIFFLPVIVASGVVINIMSGDLYASLMESGNQQVSGSMVESTVLKQMLAVYGLRDDIINAIIGTIDTIFQLAWRSGIQILIFLASLQSIPGTLYESSSIEGANGWEDFWFITLPMISPILVVNCVYTIIDGFTDFNNVLMSHIFGYVNKLSYGISSAMAWTYFVIIAIIIAVVFKVINKRAFSAL